MSNKADRNKDGKATPILTPPDANSSSENSRPRAPYLVLATGVVLVILALIVMFIPLASDPVQTSNEVVPEEKPKEPTGNSTQPKEDRQAAAEIEKLLAVWLQKQAAAEAENVSAWGGEDYAEAVSLAGECNRNLTENQYQLAGQSCSAAISGLDLLMAQKPQLLDNEILAGEQALLDMDIQGATAHFQKALAIDEANLRARSGAQRAANLPQVLQLVEDGEGLEAAGDLEGAVLVFTAAAKLDPEFEPATTGLARVEASIAGQQFQQAMSRALQAFDEGRLGSAEKALRQARALRPDDPAVQDLEQQLGKTRLSSSLARLRQQALDHEQDERWQQALKACEEALKLEPDAAFAATCKSRATARIELDRRLAGFLSSPEKLFEDAPLEEARQLLASAARISPQGPKLAGQTERLSVLVREAGIEVEVVITSDDLTEVTIYHVGRLGHFLEKKLVLRTGDYTAVGSRNGYRDVRKILKVRPGSGALHFTLRCEEPI